MNRFLILLISVLLISCSNEPPNIGIQPYGPIDQYILDSVTDILQRTYKTEVTVLKEKKLPESAFVNIKSPRYRADYLLVDLAKNRPDSIDYLLGITSKDISTTKRDENGKIKSPQSKYSDWGIFGLGYMPGNSCVISTYRLKTAKKDLFLSRIQKICIHEIGHNIGLEHCDTERCVMQDAVETISTVDDEGDEFCDKCLRKM